MVEPSVPSDDVVAASRSTAIRFATVGAGGFVLVLLLTAPLRGEPRLVYGCYLGLLGLLALAHYWRDRHRTWAGLLCSLGAFVLVTILTSVRGGVTNAPAMTSYVTLVVFSALCWSARGAVLVAALSTAAVGWMTYTGPQSAAMPPLQLWAEMSFQLVAVAWISGAALRAISHAALQSLLLEGERIRAREAREELEARISHSQSLEAVGRLAGGVAHDFNNLLTVILSEVELLRRAKLGPHLQGDVDRIEDAAGRAAKLTSQLLAVGRKQVLQPVVLCPAHVVHGLHPLLRRLLPSSSELVVLADEETGHVTVDETHLEQVLINLVTNASDSLTGGGTITLLTHNLTVHAAANQRRVPAGEYVEIRVSDTGAGMSEEVRTHIFEPFFTTKGGQKGTGLGLATVLGIVTQSGGHVEVETALGSGSTFRVLFPRTHERVSRSRTPSVRPAAARSAHILLVEDEADVRVATRRILESLGHTVVEAHDGTAALELAQKRAGEFELLISDIVMPGMGGPALATELRAQNPELRVLFISGYAAENLPHHGEFPAGEQYLSKPFSRAALGAKLADVLGSVN